MQTWITINCNGRQRNMEHVMEYGACSTWWWWWWEIIHQKWWCNPQCCFFVYTFVSVGCRLCVLGWNCTSQVAECNLKLKDMKCTLHVARCMLQVACYRLQAAGTGYWLQLQVVACLPPVTFCKVTNWQKLYSGMSKSNIFQLKIT